MAELRGLVMEIMLLLMEYMRRELPHGGDKLSALLIGRRECQLRGQSFTRSFLLPFRF
jgi:hypothetical protein